MARADEPFDPVNKPKHYNVHPSGIECIELSESMGFCSGNALKYVWRAGLKDGEHNLKDLKKARWYLDRAISVAGAESWSGERGARRAESRLLGLMTSVVAHHAYDVARMIRHLVQGELEHRSGAQLEEWRQALWHLDSYIRAEEEAQ